MTNDSGEKTVPYSFAFSANELAAKLRTVKLKQPQT
jgi:hypothetical protein